MRHLENFKLKKSNNDSPHVTCCSAIVSLAIIFVRLIGGNRWRYIQIVVVPINAALLMLHPMATAIIALDVSQASRFALLLLGSYRLDWFDMFFFYGSL
jgi:hypothetical protein